MSYPAPMQPWTPPVAPARSKSAVLAAVLTLCFGPLGMLYSTVPGGLIMLVVFVPAAVLAFFTLGISLIVYWIACVIWACVAATR